LLYGLWRSLAAKVAVQTVCYSVGGVILVLGLWSPALGLWP
jgi:hypothetical protein